jgi:hypothetical protein
MVVINKLYLIKNEKFHFYKTVFCRLHRQLMLWAISKTPFKKGLADLGIYIKFLQQNWKTNINPSNKIKNAYNLCLEENLQNIQFAFNAFQKQQTAKGGNYIILPLKLANLQA